MENENGQEVLEENGDQDGIDIKLFCQVNDDPDPDWISREKKMMSMPVIG